MGDGGRAESSQAIAVCQSHRLSGQKSHRCWRQVDVDHRSAV
jgi:hypothetical protein